MAVPNNLVVLHISFGTDFRWACPGGIATGWLARVIATAFPNFRPARRRRAGRMFGNRANGIRTELADQSNLRRGEPGR
jgi:hypothetical protein